MKRVGVVLLLLFFTMSAFAAKIRIVTPYVGSLTNSLEMAEPMYKLKLKDSGVMEGLYFMCLDPAKHQWNAFLYGSQDVNESDLLGGHFIYDHYFKHTSAGRFVLGAGYDYIQIKTDADELHVMAPMPPSMKLLVLTQILNFKMTNKISAIYARAGRYFNIKQKQNRYSAFLWAGYERDIVRGDLTFQIPFPPNMPPIKQDIESDYDYALAGVALKATFMHFLEIKGKYHRKISLNEDEESLNVFSILTNVYFSRSWGISYRYKNMEATFGKNSYHIGGVVYIF